MDVIATATTVETNSKQPKQQYETCSWFFCLWTKMEAENLFVNAREAFEPR